MIAKTLDWSCNNYEDGGKEFIAKVTTLNFEGPNNLIMNYSVIETGENNFNIYFVCNYDMFKVAKVTTFESVHTIVSEHLKGIIRSLQMLIQAC